MKEYSVVRMFSEELDRDIRVFIMIPASYFKNDRRYPVLYMHDGQNLFDPKQAYDNESWGILESYEKYPDLPEVIIVGIENGGDERTNELVPLKFNFADSGYPDYGSKEVGGNTEQYMNFILKQLKPYIDKTYRTYKSPKNTAIMGSSFGGVCSLYAAFKYTKYFGRFACLSNAHLYFQEAFEKLAADSDLSKVKKLYLDVGSNESSQKENSLLYVESNESLYNILKSKVESSKIKFEIIDGAIHHESAWAVRFPEIIKYLFND